MPQVGTLDLRTFIPAKDFVTSKSFYLALGFALTWEDPGMAIFDTGAGSFFLQNYYQAEWADNCMMNLVVADVAAWRGHIKASGVIERFAVRVTEPKAGPHGTIFDLFDSSGVLWHIQQQ